MDAHSKCNINVQTIIIQESLKDVQSWICSNIGKGYQVADNIIQETLKDVHFFVCAVLDMIQI